MVVYPRWRGELFCALAFCWLSRGLSPLARGTLCRCQHCWRVITVYPRWRGEHRSSHYFPFFFDGYLLLARGTRRQRIVRLPLHRFIPAGGTSTLSITTDREPVYPRWRGEHWQNKHRGTRGAGLSPLARGTLDQAVLFFQRLSVYPRWRGEHLRLNSEQAIGVGLSPLARGTRCSVNIDGDVTRFIPAGAGNTFLRLFMRIKNSLYPRWRGEHRRGLTSRPSQTSLSPLARGTPVVTCRWPGGTVYPRWRGEHPFIFVSSWRDLRFIPAGAGNTIDMFHAVKQAAVYPRWRGEH